MLDFVILRQVGTPHVRSIVGVDTFFSDEMQDMEEERVDQDGDVSIQDLKDHFRKLCHVMHELERRIALNMMGIAADDEFKPHEMCEDVRKVMSRSCAQDILRTFGYRCNKKRTRMKYWLEENMYRDINVSRPIDVAEDLDSDVFNYIYVHYVLYPRRMQVIRSKETKAKKLMALCAQNEGGSNAEAEAGSLRSETGAIDDNDASVSCDEEMM